MANLTVTGTGFVRYTGPRIIDLIDFDTTGPATVLISTDRLRFSAPTVLDLSVLGSPHIDTLAIQTVGDGSLDARLVRFEPDWLHRDALVLRDTLGDGTILGSARSDRIVVSGGVDSVHGDGGEDTLVVRYGDRAESFEMDGRLAILGNASLSVSFAGIARLDVTLGDGRDDITGLAGDDVLRGGGRADNLRGAGGDDALFGDDGADLLRGGDGRDRLDGGAGGDTLIGRLGGDVLVVDDKRDKVIELAGQGIDTVRSSISYDLFGTRVENLTLLGNADLQADGNNRTNVITGNTGRNLIAGHGGGDDLRLAGDAARDTVSFSDASDSTGPGRDVLRDFDARAEDVLLLQLSGDIASNFDGIEVSSFTGGSLDAASFDADISAALDGNLSPGGLTQAILWDPTGGDLNRPGHRYLVIDLDNDGAYETGSDYVMQFVRLQGVLGASDFSITAVL